jgi:hypothetical protein
VLRHAEGTLMALREIIKAAAAEQGCTLDDLTVMAQLHDPYRLDTPAHHRDSEWIVERIAIRDTAKGDPGGLHKFHLRGLHYSIVKAGDVIKPNGKVYENTYNDWDWLKTTLKGARWLGYVPFDRITDRRNPDPVIHRFRSESREPIALQSSSSVGGLQVYEPAVTYVSEPHANLFGFGAEQPYALAIFGEKSSLEEVLLPIAQRYDADLYLSSGDASDTHVHQIAKDAHEDGRPLVVFTFSDFDPQGYWMPACIARKLQAHKNMLYKELSFKVITVSVTKEQVSSLGVKSTPLKESECRKDRWRAEFGVDQTEIDALVEDHPEALEQIAIDAIKPYFDDTLADRVRTAEQAWKSEAEARLIATDPELAADAESEADDAASTFNEAMDEFKAEIDRINEELLDSYERVELPPIPPVPEPELNDDENESLVDFDDDWLEATKKLMVRKAYGNGGDE